MQTYIYNYNTKIHDYYNDNFVFISEGIWFKKNTIVRLNDNESSMWYGFWYSGHKYDQHKKFYTLEEILEDKNNFLAAFVGTRVCQHSSEGGKSIGEEYESLEICNLSEFKIVLKKEYEKEINYSI